jgi:hypothetical protein
MAGTNPEFDMAEPKLITSDRTDSKQLDWIFTRVHAFNPIRTSWKADWKYCAK